MLSLGTARFSKLLGLVARRFNQACRALSGASEFFVSLLCLLGVARLFGFFESFQALRERAGFATYATHLLGVTLDRAFDVVVGFALLDELRFELSENFRNLAVVFDAGRLVVQLLGALQTAVHHREQLVAAFDAFERLAARASQPDPQP